jgi:oligopeptide transport system permease protein
MEHFMKNRKIQPAAVSGDAGAAVITAPSNWQETDAWLDGIDFKDDDFEFQHKDGFRHVDHVFAGRSYWADAFARFKANRGAVFGFICICVLVFFAIVGPYMNDYTYDQQNILLQNMAPRVQGLENLGIFDGSENMKTSTGTREINNYTTPGNENLYFWFGTDSLGRDIWTRTWTGTRISLYVAAVAVICDLLIGVTYGLISGYFGGRVDMIMQRIVEVLNSIPYLVTVTLLLLILKPGLMTITLALVITGWIGMSRIARAEILKIKEREYILASRTLGAKNFWIIFREALPNMIGPLITQTMFSIPHAIFTEAFLAFIGLGVPEPMASLGSMISSGYRNFTTHPYMIVAPIIVMGLLMLSFTLFADGLRDALDPKMKEM